LRIGKRKERNRGRVNLYYGNDLGMGGVKKRGGKGNFQTEGGGSESVIVTREIRKGRGGAFRNESPCSYNLGVNFRWFPAWPEKKGKGKEKMRERVGKIGENSRRRKGGPASLRGVLFLPIVKVTFPR